MSYDAPQKLALLLIRLLKLFVPRRIRPKLRRLYYRGKKYYCLFCNKTCRTFLPSGLDEPVLSEYHIIGGFLRKNAICPLCWSTDRERLLAIFLKKYLLASSHKNIKLLHVAPERNLSKMLLGYPNIRYESGDKFGFHCASDGKTSEMDVTRLPFPDNDFDMVICCHVLEHVENDRLAMSELFRVLKPGGISILQVPISPILKETYEDASIVTPQQRLKSFGQNDHVRIYGQDYTHRLEHAGFTVTIINVANEHPDFVEKYQINPEENLFIATKMTHPSMAIIPLSRGSREFLR